MHRVPRWMLLSVVLATVLIGCGGDGDGDGDADSATESADSADDSSPVSDDSTTDSAGSGDSGGTLTLGFESIAFDSARCFLQEQDAAAGGGKILFVVQAFGTNAEGEELMIDVSRYDEDSQFVGDDILVDIGDPFSSDAISWGAPADLGTVQIDGSMVSAAGLTFRNFDTAEELPGSFSISC